MKSNLRKGTLKMILKKIACFGGNLEYQREIYIQQVQFIVFLRTCIIIWWWERNMSSHYAVIQIVLTYWHPVHDMGLLLSEYWIITLTTGEINGIKLSFSKCNLDYYRSECVEGNALLKCSKKVHSMYCVISILKIKSLTGIPALNVIPYETLSRS